MNRIGKHLLLPLLGAVLLAGCNKVPGEKAAGIELEIFTELASAQTKVSYLDDAGNEHLDEVNYRVLLHWETGDKVRIASANATLESTPSRNWQDYQVSAITNTASRSTATIVPVGGEKLDWKDGTTGSQTLYALYPSPSAVSGFSLSAAGAVTGTIPSEQTLVQRGSANIFDPADMRYACMWGRQSAAPDALVSFSLKPLFTAFEFEVCASESYPSVTLTRMELRNGSDLAGSFSCDLSATEPSASVTEGEPIIVDFTAITGCPDGITAASEPVKFTVLALGCAHSNVTITLYGNELGGPRRLLFKDRTSGVPLTFEAGKKYRIHGLSFPSTLNIAFGEEIDWNGFVNTGETVDWDNGHLNRGENIHWN